MYLFVSLNGGVIYNGVSIMIGLNFIRRCFFSVVFPTIFFCILIWVYYFFMEGLNIGSVGIVTYGIVFSVFYILVYLFFGKILSYIRVDKK